MASTLSSIDTQHEDMIHDAQFDYYSRKVATCSSDRTIKIYEVGDNNVNTQVAEIKGHEGPVWQLAWAHPKFGSILASCSYDRRVIVWKEGSPNVWSKLYEYDKHGSSVNSIAWSPHEFGLVLTCGSSDGTISVHAYKGDDTTWTEYTIPQAHAIGVNSVSWAPAISAGSLVSVGGSNTNVHTNTVNAPNIPRRFVSGGCDNLVKIWRFVDAENKWTLEETLTHHTDWVRDVSWAPNIGLPLNTIASCSQDGTVVIWTQDNSTSSSSSWSKKVLPKFADVVWRVSWSTTGNILAVSGGDNKVTLWKEGLDSEWKCIQDLDETDSTTHN